MPFVISSFLIRCLFPFDRLSLFRWIFATDTNNRPIQDRQDLELGDAATSQAATARLLAIRVSDRVSSLGHFWRAELGQFS
jgi:hypothetical protein